MKFFKFYLSPENLDVQLPAPSTDHFPIIHCIDTNSLFYNMSNVKSAYSEEKPVHDVKPYETT